MSFISFDAIFASLMYALKPSTLSASKTSSGTIVTALLVVVIALLFFVAISFAFVMISCTNSTLQSEIASRVMLGHFMSAVRVGGGDAAVLALFLFFEVVVVMVVVFFFFLDVVVVDSSTKGVTSRIRFITIRGMLMMLCIFFSCFVTEWILFLL